LSKIILFGERSLRRFQFWGDAQNFQRQLREHFAQFNLELAEKKTRLLLFGRFAAVERRKHGHRPETFEFLGFKHVCGEDRAGRYFNSSQQVTRIAVLMFASKRRGSPRRTRHRHLP
jgi:hypothetical protein